MQTIPTILEKDPQELVKQIIKLSPYFSRFQIDVADGIFVSNKTLPIEDVIKTLQQSNNSTLDISKLNFDFHLMVQDYQNELKKLTQSPDWLKVDVIFIHASLNPNLQQLTISYPQYNFGLVLNPADSVSTLNFQLSTFSSIQIMTVHPGFQGSQFLPQMLQKIDQLRQAGYRSNIFIDGGINDETLPIIIKQSYQPDFLCIGSFFTKTNRLETNIDIIKSLLSNTEQIYNK